MYQTEDLVTSFDFNLNEINEYVIKHMSKDSEEIKALLLWYADIIDQMKQENLPAKGKRLSSTQAYVEQLSRLHAKQLDDNEAYQQLFAEADSEIRQQIEWSDGQVHDPVQVCLNAVYGKLVINLNGKSLPSEQEKMVARFGKVLAHLNREYHRSE